MVSRSGVPPALWGKKVRPECIKQGWCVDEGSLVYNAHEVSVISFLSPEELISFPAKDIFRIMKTLCLRMNLTLEQWVDAYSSIFVGADVGKVYTRAAASAPFDPPSQLRGSFADDWVREWEKTPTMLELFVDRSKTVPELMACIASV
eukprot:TRINITY_DN16038_c0_g1_i1.p1 TRINITY_DN16038_c0_g1~~TRINITY_DN16038_c0_g1_i1.p1  ORF type:complete len:148 (-),score=0.57 TRINITY_DN16038_c0_g1_i1:32-475(-)